MPQALPAVLITTPIARRRQPSRTPLGAPKETQIHATAEKSRRQSAGPFHGNTFVSTAAWRVAAWPCVRRISASIDLPTPISVLTPGASEARLGALV
jgi:hypothetical protein